MFVRVIEKIAYFIKKEPYKIDKLISDRDLFNFLVKRIIMIIRGFVFTRKILFLGKRVNIFYKYKISFGRSITLHDDVEIDALSENGIILGKNVSIGKNSFIRCTAGLQKIGQGLFIGENVGIGSNAYLGCWGGIVIGKDTIIGERFTVHSDNHEFSDMSMLIRHQNVKKMPVEIGEDCWIGSNVTVLGGVNVGKGCVIGAGSVVTKNIPDYSVVVGNPAHVIKNRKERYLNCEKN